MDENIASGLPWIPAQRFSPGPSSGTRGELDSADPVGAYILLWVKAESWAVVLVTVSGSL